MTGSAVHVGLASWYTDGDMGKAIQAFKDKYTEETGGSYIGEEYEIISEQIAMGERMLKEYEREYPYEQWEMARPETTFKVVLGDKCWRCGKLYPPDVNQRVKKAKNEEIFRWECSECTSPVHCLIGRADLIVTWNGKLFTVEHKTAKQAQANYIESFRRATQVSAYVYGISRHLGHRVSGTFVNILKKTKVPQYVRDVFLRSGKSLQWFEYDAIAFCEDVHRWKKSNWWQQYTEECYRFSRCPFIPICDRYEKYMDIPKEEIIPLGFEHREPDYGDEQYVEEEQR
jgi:hypothetical protein